MLSVKPVAGTLAQRLAGPDLTGEQRLEAEMFWPTLVVCQEHPDIAVIATTGIFLPPHERTMLYTAHSGAQTNVYVCSRGTSKSTAIDVIYPTYVSLYFSKRKSILLSTAGFRG